MTDSAEHHDTTFEVRVLRQDEPRSTSYWQRFRLKRESDMNVISVLQRIAESAVTADGRAVAPVAWSCNCLEEVCGACTMLINGTVRQACSALVDRLLAEEPQGIELRPLSRFPVVRDLVVDRRRLFRALERIKGWIPVDGYYDLGRGPLQSQEEQEIAYPLSECMSCGCCLEACPQYKLIELAPLPSESESDFRAREREAHDQAFMGVHAIGQALLFNAHPTGKMNADERLDALMAPGGIQGCGNSQNCVEVCPKHIPNTTSIARASRATTVELFRRLFDK